MDVPEVKKDNLPYCFTFRTKEEATKFLAWMRKNSYMHNVVSINDIMRDRKGPITRDGFDHGYSRAEIKKFKEKKVDGVWIVSIPPPKKFVRDINGYWTTKEDDGG